MVGTYTYVKAEWDTEFVNTIIWNSELASSLCETFHEIGILENDLIYFDKAHTVYFL